jgi:hypothetical protein
LLGAVIGTEISYVAPDATEAGKLTEEAPIESPPVFWNLNPASQAQEPEFCTFHVLVKDLPALICVLSGMVTSLTKVKP